MRTSSASSVHFARLGLVLALTLSVGCSDSKVPDNEGDADVAAGSGGGGSGGMSGAGGMSGSGGMSGAGGMSGSGGMSGAGGTNGDAAMDAGDQDDAAIDAATEDAGDAGELTDSGDSTDAGPDAGDAADPESCTPFTEEPCEGNEVGPCTAGTHTCLEDGSGYGACEGVVLPAPPQCGGDDFDCNGTPDGEQDVDEDGDGFTRCVSDCCDRESDCDDPALINPGAYDYAGDTIDNDCSGTADDATTSCDDALTSDSIDAMDHARALELCQTTTTSPPAVDRVWGVLSASFTRANGASTPVAAQRSIRPDFGAIGVQHGASMLVLSTGVAAAPGDTNPSFVAPSLGTDHTTTSAAPADWTAANSSAIPASPGCPQPATTTVHDPIMLTLQVRVPTNARAFKLDGYFLSSDYPEWVCSTFTDYFVALLSSSYNGTPANPSDRNIAAYSVAAGVTPVSANLARGTGFFQQCLDGALGCGPGATASTTDGCVGTAELANTGFDAANMNLCTAESIVGGGTGWLSFGGNVVPGETAYLRFAIWDNTDGIEDSHILLDNLRWLRDPITPGLQTE